MEISQFIEFSKKIREISEKVEYQNTLSQLRSVLTQYKNQNSSVNQPNNSIRRQQLLTHKATIEKTTEEALSKLENIQKEISNINFTKVLNSLKIKFLFGDYANSLLEKISKDLEVDFDNIINEFNSYYQKFTAFNQFIGKASLFFDDETLEANSPTNELILIFEGESSVNNLKELSKVSGDWNQIVNCFARLTNDNDTDINIVSIRKGSLIATLSISLGIILGIIKASDKILDLILKIYEVRKKALELKSMKLETIASAIEILEKQSTINLKLQSKEITKELLQEYGWKEKDELFHETKIAVKKAVKKMIEFQNSGGKIDSYLIDATEKDKDDLQILRMKNKKLLDIEENVKNLTGTSQILKIESNEDQEENIEDNTIDEDISSQEDMA